MNHDAAIQAIIKDLLADKSIPAEYRNAVASSGRRWQCEIRGVKSLTRLEAPQGTFGNETGNLAVAGSNASHGYSPQATGQQNGSCTCPVGGRRTTCPVHGEQQSN